ncbi:YtpI family protein [Oceanobacillus sp. 1P07AA]|uniref:YtpI family protein n=1 Tax=Oceanobacillus sp. 1P07AA TaxID=3132293 RepID=UPI0039A53EEB
MVIFPIFIVLSAVLYIYYKVAIIREKDILTQRYFNGKARICLGIFLSAFAINQYLNYLTQLSLFIGILLLVFGILQLVRGIGETKHYRSEWRRLNPNE